MTDKDMLDLFELIKQHGLVVTLEKYGQQVRRYEFTPANGERLVQYMQALP